MITSTMNAPLPVPSQSWIEPFMPNACRAELTRPYCGAIAKTFTNICAMATVGSTTGKNTSVRTSAEDRRK